MPKLRCICGASKAPRKELAVLKAKLADALAQNEPPDVKDIPYGKDGGVMPRETLEACYWRQVESIKYYIENETMLLDEIKELKKLLKEKS